MKPKNLVSCLISATRINSYCIRNIEVDMRHINYGLNKSKDYKTHKRSDFSVEDLINFFESLNLIEVNSEKDGEWEYFVINKEFFEKKRKYRIVFCIHKDSPNKCGIITFYQIKRSAYELS